ncbi:PRP39 pre-mRNA processing factor 39 [Mortierella sp. GBA30]|nr:PRP39 pre-mRNA processing factor 39 [Mortierella sp. GBA30]
MENLAGDTAAAAHQVIHEQEPQNNGEDQPQVEIAAPSEPPTMTPSGAPMPTTTDPTLIEAWDRCWAIVKATPTEFDAWEELMRLADRQDGGFGPDAPSANIANVRTIYDAFLSQFPLCFGYWKKYSDLEFLATGTEGAIEIFERGVKSISNSVDLWVQYCSFVMEQKPAERDLIEQLFERGASAVGMDFMPHVFWDKFIAFYEEKEEYSKLATLMERIIKIPMHQYARYYQQYAQLVSTRPLSELFSEEKYSEYKEQLTSGKTIEGQDEGESKEEEKTKEELEAELRQMILERSALVHARTAEETNKRWPFEAEIKRPYFHVKPMDLPQLANWRRYLDFEEAEGDVERIRVLFERCLVTCALYEEFWLRYGAWARSQNDLDVLQDIYTRAVVMVPPSNPSLRLTLAMVKEERGDIEESRKHYQTVLQQLPGHIETIVRFANFERRTSPNDLAAAEVVYASQLGLDNVDELTQTAIVTLYARFLWQAKKDAEAARAIFKTGEGKFDSKFFFSTYLKFEMDQPGEDYEKRVSGVFEQIRYSGLPEAVKNDYAQSYLDFVMEFGSSAARYNQLEADIKAPSVFVQESKKRAAAEQADEEERKKPRAEDETMAMDGSAVMDAQVGIPAGGAGMDPAAMYGHQQQPPQWGAANSAAAYGYAATAYPYAPVPVQPGSQWNYAQTGDPSGQY